MLAARPNNRAEPDAQPSPPRREAAARNRETFGPPLLAPLPVGYAAAPGCHKTVMLLLGPMNNYGNIGRSVWIIQSTPVMDVFSTNMGRLVGSGEAAPSRSISARKEAVKVGKIRGCRTVKVRVTTTTIACRFRPGYFRDPSERVADREHLDEAERTKPLWAGADVSAAQAARG